MLKDDTNRKKVFLWLDKNWGGGIAEYRIAEKLKESGVEFNIKIPKGKDWNEDLLTAKEQAILRNTEARECPGLRYS